MQYSVVWYGRDLNPYAAGGYFGQYKMMQKSEKITKTLANGYSSESAQRELSNEYQHGKVWRVFKNLCILVLWMKVASAFEGLTFALSFSRFVLVLALFC